MNKIKYLLLNIDDFAPSDIAMLRRAKGKDGLAVYPGADLRYFHRTGMPLKSRTVHFLSDENPIVIPAHIGIKCHPAAPPPPHGHIR